jgi:hypothetical protein
MVCVMVRLSYTAAHLTPPENLCAHCIEISHFYNFSPSNIICNSKAISLKEITF